MKKAISPIVVVMVLLIISILSMGAAYYIIQMGTVSIASSYNETELVKVTNVTINITDFHYIVPTLPPIDACDSGGGWSSQDPNILDTEACDRADCCGPKVIEYVFDLSQDAVLSPNGFVKIFLALEDNPGASVSPVASGDIIKISYSQDGDEWRDLYVTYSPSGEFISHGKSVSKTLENGTTYNGREFMLPISFYFKYVKVLMPRTYLKYGEAVYLPFVFQPSIKDIEYEDIFNSYYPEDPKGFCAANLTTLRPGWGYMIYITGEDYINWEYCGGNAC